MPALVTTLNARLEAADASFHQGRLAAALAAYQELLAQARERVDRPMEVIARSMASRCLLRRRDLDGAFEQLDQAEGLTDPMHLQAHGRYQSARARLDLARGRGDASLRTYLDWAEDHGHHVGIADACALLAEQAEAEERAVYLERAIEASVRGSLPGLLGRLYTDLGAVLDELERADEALAAYERALETHREHGSSRQVVGGCWAVGAAAGRAEDYPLARQRLEEAVRLGESSDDALDLVALALADLSDVYQAAGDVVEARRLLLRAVELGREQELPTLWPERWRTLMKQGRELDLDV